LEQETAHQRLYLALYFCDAADQNFWDDALYSSVLGKILKPNFVTNCMPDPITNATNHVGVQAAWSCTACCHPGYWSLHHQLGLIG
jgi:hypothetical protein